MRTMPLMLITAATLGLVGGARPAGAAQGPSHVPGPSAWSAASSFRVLPAPPAADLAQDPADSLFRAARTALSREEFSRAATLFRRIRDAYPRSAHAGDSHYWEAFALYRQGGSEDLKVALEVLDLHRKRYPDAGTSRDADALRVRIQGQLARRGDADAAEDIAETARELAESQRELAREAGESQRELAREIAESQRDAGREAARAGREAARVARGERGGRNQRPAGCPEDDDEDLRVAALNALLQMSAEQAVPILQQVLKKRDACSAPLRRKAVFLLSQKRTPETENLMVDLVRNDPDPEVREQAVFWLSQVPTDRALSALEDILRTSTDPRVQVKAVFAVSQHRSARAGTILRDYAERDNVPDHVREQAIFWLGQKRSAENAQYLKALYPKLKTEKLKDKAIFSLSQMKGEGNDKFLMDIALNDKEPLQMRKQALFWAGQMGAPLEGLGALYDRMPDREMKEQIIFVLSQRRAQAAVDKLIDIARKEKDRELRKKAIFWLSQSKDPRVAQILLEIISQ